MLDPTKLCDGLARVATALGVTIHEGTRVVGLERVPRGVRVRTIGSSADGPEPFGWARRIGLPFEPVELLGRRPDVTVRGRSSGTIEATHVVVATSAYSGWYPRLTPLFVPVYDYVLVSDPLGPSSARRSAGPAVRR